MALPSAAPVVLLSGGGKGLGRLSRDAQALLAASPRAHLLVLCGANENLHGALSAHREAGARLRVFGPQPAELVATMMAAGDLHLGKPGGLSAAESLASGLPMVLSRPLPGQEEDNARRLVELGAAAACSPDQAVEMAARLLENRAALRGLRLAAASVGRPDAAARAAFEIAALARNWALVPVI